MSKHTVGPWAAPRNLMIDQNKKLYISDSTGNWDICAIAVDYAPSAEQGYANAQLISAAPELLDALERIIAISDRKHDTWDYAKTIIAKARGEK